jgi:ribosomal protein S25
MNHQEFMDLVRKMRLAQQDPTRNPSESLTEAKRLERQVDKEILRMSEWRNRITKQESFRLKQAIREHVLDSLKKQDWITVNDIRAKFGRDTCKETFARSRLNELVKEGVLVSRDNLGFRMYSLADSRI